MGHVVVLALGMLGGILVAAEVSGHDPASVGVSAAFVFGAALLGLMLLTIVA